MIAKLEWTQSNVQQNIEQLQNPTMTQLKFMGIIINNNSRTTDQTLKNAEPVQCFHCLLTTLKLN